MSDTQVLEFRYSYEFEDGTKREFDVRIDEATMCLMQPGRPEYPPWTALECCRCPNCPLEESENARCPSAVALIDVVDFCKDRISHEKVRASVRTRNRDYARSTTLYQALSSLIGIIMATGGCPVMERLRPMARFHLPFADDDETMYRAMSAYLLGQYFIMKSGGEPDWSMAKLVGMYDDIREVNRSFCNRLRTVSSKDSNINAVIGLDCFADLVIFSINERFMDQLDILYQSYVKRQG